MWKWSIQKLIMWVMASDYSARTWLGITTQMVGPLWWQPNAFFCVGLSGFGVAPM
jgi:hypothetical protein